MAEFYFQREDAAKMFASLTGLGIEHYPFFENGWSWLVEDPEDHDNAIVFVDENLDVTTASEAWVPNWPVGAASELDDLRKDVDFLARMMCVTPPSRRK